MTKVNKDWLIKKLGGYTAKEMQIITDAKVSRLSDEDLQKLNDGQYKAGQRKIVYNLVNLAKRMYGCDADTWCKTMYKEIARLCKELEVKK